MRVTMMATACLAVFVVAGCSDASEPSPPPAPVDSLTDTSEDPPPDSDTETETETSSAPPPDDVEETTQASGPPELPPEATEQTEAGADAFVRYYFNRLNYGTMTPASDALDDTAVAGCQTCASLEDSLSSLASEGLRSEGPSALLMSSVATIDGDRAVVESIFMQVNPPTVTEDGTVATPGRESTQVTFSFRLEWTDSGWRISEIE